MFTLLCSYWTFIFAIKHLVMILKIFERQRRGWTEKKKRPGGSWPWIISSKPQPLVCLPEGRLLSRTKRSFSFFFSLIEAEVFLKSKGEKTLTEKTFCLFCSRSPAGVWRSTKANPSIYCSFKTKAKQREGLITLSTANSRMSFPAFQTTLAVQLSIMFLSTLLASLSGPDAIRETEIWF